MNQIRAVILCALIAIAFTREAQADESPLVEMQIRLIAPIHIKLPPRYFLCTVYENYFHVSSALLKRRVTITAENGVSIHFPWQAHQCKAVEIWAK